MSCTNCQAGCTDTTNHCDSTAFDSSCTDQGQGFPLSVKAGCDLPTGYEPIPGIVGVWTGTEWILDSTP